MSPYNPHFGYTRRKIVKPLESEIYIEHDVDWFDSAYNYFKTSDWDERVALVRDILGTEEPLYIVKAVTRMIARGKVDMYSIQSYSSDADHIVAALQSNKHNDRLVARFVEYKDGFSIDRIHVPGWIQQTQGLIEHIANSLAYEEVIKVLDEVSEFIEHCDLIDRETFKAINMRLVELQDEARCLISKN